jgi:hypothetical protein
VRPPGGLYSRCQLLRKAAIAASRVGRSRASVCDPHDARRLICPHPGRAYGRRIGLEDAADNGAICQHVEIILVPLARWPARGCPFEDQLAHLAESYRNRWLHSPSTLPSSREAGLAVAAASRAVLVQSDRVEAVSRSPPVPNAPTLAPFLRAMSGCY